MSVNAAVLSRLPILPWTVVDEEERRFRRILLWVGVPFLLLGLLLPYLPLPELPEPVRDPLPPPTITIEFRPTPPPPAPAPEVRAPVAPRNEIATPEPVPKPVPKPAPRPAPSAREQAANAGVLAAREALSDLRSGDTSKLGQGPLSVLGNDAPRTERAMLTSNVGGGSGGINTGALSRDTGGGTTLGGRNVSQVHSPIGGGTGAAAASGTSSRNKKGGRSDEEIQLVFDRNKGGIFSIYNRSLRENPALQGKVVLRLTIAPSGEVLKVGVVSSELKDPALERKLTQRVKTFNFGAKDVDTVTVTYPIEFFPS